MSEIISHQYELASIIKRYTEQDGVFSTALPSLFFMRQSKPSETNYEVYKPSFCIVIQGIKEVWLAGKPYQYGPSNYLVASVSLPVAAQVIEASSDVPLIGLRLEFTGNQILEVISASKIRLEAGVKEQRGLFVSPVELSLLDAVIRLVRLLDHPKDIPLLAPMFTKEILYRILQGQHGAILEQIAVKGSSANQIKDVIEHITMNYAKPFRLKELAGIVSMSVSSLHRHFKEVTALSPLQYQKQIRLQEARRLLLTEAIDAAEVAFQVGYESPSQFSREYSRMFGLPPKEDVKQLRV